MANMLRLGFRRGFSTARCLLQNLEDARKSTLAAIIDQFEEPVDYAVGYGSGVFSQGLAQRNSNTQIDLILGVKDPEKWHTKNIRANPSHYSGLKYLGPSFVSLIQDKLGAGVYFNPFCTINGLKVKYGVVSIDRMLDDLENWRTLYLAGRMHKPVQILRSEDRIGHAQKINLISAMSLALMLLPKTFSERDLYMKITSISYMGDVRMAIAENPRKVQNIVDNQFKHFRRLYGPIMKNFELDITGSIDPLSSLGPEAKGAAFEHNGSFDTLRKTLPAYFEKKLSKTPFSQQLVTSAVRNTVKWPSFTQSLKGVLTAGIGRSAAYSLEKLKKRWS